MENVPDDVLIQIFREYVSKKSIMPISITSVCRRWYNLATTTSSLWSNVNIHLISIYTISKLLASSSSSGLETYLSRSEANGAEVPLDITIKWDASETPVGDHGQCCDWRWFEGVRCGKGPCSYETKCQEQIKKLFMVLAGISTPAENLSEGSTSMSSSPAAPPSSAPPTPALSTPQNRRNPQRLKRWKTLTLNFDTQMKTMCMEIPFEPFNDPIYQAPNLTTLTFEGVVGCEPGLHPNFAPKLDMISLTDSAAMGFPDLTNLKNLEVMKSPTNSIPTGRNWVDVPNVENLSISLPPSDVTTGKFPALKALQIYRSINYMLLTCLEMGATARKPSSGSGSSIAEVTRLEFITMRDISPESLIEMSNGVYTTNAELIIFSISPVTKRNRKFIFHGVSKKKYVEALATFMWHCAEDTQIVAGSPLGADLLAEARRLNEEDEGN